MKSAPKFLLIMLLAAIAMLSGCAAPAAPAPGAAAGEATEAAAESSAGLPELSREQTLVFENISERVTSPENYNPYIPSTLLHAGLQQIGFESLFYYNYETGELVPWLAESYSYNDTFDEVTIKLRQGAMWSDGEPFTADDVVYTLETLKANAPMMGGWSVDAQTWVDTVTAVDANTVTIKLTGANPRYVFNEFGVRIYGTTFILPRHIWEGQDPTTFSNFDLAQGWPITTGPYQLVSSTSTETVWDRRSGWWGAETGFHALPAPERIVFRTAGNEERRAAMAINNELDTLWVMGRNTFETVMAQNPNVSSWFAEPPYAYLDPCPRYIGLNTMLPPFDDPQIRQAISYAVNRDQVVDVGWEGLTLTSTWLLPDYAPLQSYMDENQDLFQQYGSGEYSLERVAEIMTGKGYTQDGDGFWTKDGQTITMNLIIRAGETDQVKMAPVVAELLQRGGFDATFTLQDIAAYGDALNNGRADSWLDVACGSVAEPYATMDNYHSRHAKPIGELATGARSRWSNADYDKLVDEMAVTSPDDPRMHELFRQALEIWLPDIPSVPLVQASLLSSFNNTYWTNWPTEDNNYVHPGHWWATAMLIVMEVQPAQQ